TTPSTSPRSISNETSCTATSVPRRVGNSRRNPMTARSGPDAAVTAITGRVSCGGRRALLLRHDLAARDVVDVIDDRRPLDLDVVLELRVEVVALAGQGRELVHLKAAATGPARRRGAQ